MKLEEQTKWMYDKMTAAAEPCTWNKGIPWKYEDEGDEWQRWERSWWIRVNQDELNSRQRRKISRGLKKMIAREKNGMARLLREEKKGIRAEVDESRRGADTNSESNEKSRERRRTHSTCALMSRHCDHTCIMSGIPSTR